MVLAGAEVGLVLGPANTDAINRAPRTSYGEATGITQTVRNFGSSLGLAVLGAVLILENKSNISRRSPRRGSRPPPPIGSPTRYCTAAVATHSFARAAAHRAREIFSDIQLDFALASRTVFYAMAGVMAVAFVVSLLAMPGGRSNRK